jgi:hypothetical protein
MARKIARLAERVFRTASQIGRLSVDRLR